MYKKYEEITIFSIFLNKILRNTSLKKNYITEEKTKNLIKKISNKKYKLPEKMGLKKEENKGMNVYSYNGTINNSKNKIIIYMHGGSYIEEAVSYQIKFAMKIAKKSNSTLIFPIYPLAPKYTFKDAYTEMDKLYQKILNTKKEIIFLGDSAGGGFSLSYSMYLRDKNKKQPQKLLLLSPWLDISLENPDIEKKEKKDICAIAGNRYAGKLWSKGTNTKNYLVSPIYGKFNDLPEITLASGEDDIMQPDCEKMSSILKNEKIKHNYIEYKGQIHDFGVFPTKEGNMLIEDFVKII